MLAAFPVARKFTLRSATLGFGKLPGSALSYRVESLQQAGQFWTQLRWDFWMSTVSPDTSASLLERAQTTASGEAWNTLVRLYTPLLHAWLTSAGLQSADRDDVTQRVLEVLVRQLAAFRHNGRTGAFRAWLRGITVNMLREFWRDRPSPATDSILQQLSDPGGQLSRLWDDQHDRHVLHSLLELVQPEFSVATWTAFKRVAVDGVAPRQVAEELGMSVNSVFVAKARVLARLRQRATGLVD
jgi:RNA polymerase sigma-70 factor (ECF subfamily)